LESSLVPNGGVIIGDEVFPLKTYLMKPYWYAQWSFEEKVFNYRLSRSRRIVENAFGILARRFRVLEKLIAVMLAQLTNEFDLCALHSLLRRTSLSTYHEVLLMKRTLIEGL
jgi:hypothetical protein